MKSPRTGVAVLFASLVIVMLGFGIVIPLMPFFVTHFQASGAALGVMISIYSLMQFAFAPMWGRLSDRIGRKPVLLIGISGYALSFFLQGISQNLVEFIAMRSLAGIVSSATLPTAMAFVADTTSPQDRSRGVGLMGAAMGLGMIIGPMLGGVLTHVTLPLPVPIAGLLQTTIDPADGRIISLSIPFFASSLLALIAIPFVLFFLPESLARHKRVTSHPVQSRTAQLAESLRGPGGFLYVMAFLLAFALANLEAVLGLYGKQRFNMGPAEIGLLMGGMGILSVIEQGLVIGPLTRRIGEEWVLKSGLVVSMLGFLGLALASQALAMSLFTLLFSAGNVLLQPSVTSLISKQTRAGQGAAMGLNNSFQSLGRGTGPLWAGFAFDMYPTLSFSTGALIQMMAFLFSLRMLRGEELLSVETGAQAASGAIPTAPEH